MVRAAPHDPHAPDLVDQLVTKIEFRGWTDEPKRRHASYKELREGADHSEVMELDAALQIAPP